MAGSLVGICVGRAEEDHISDLSYLQVGSSAIWHQRRIICMCVKRGVCYLNMLSCRVHMELLGRQLSLWICCSVKRPGLQIKFWESVACERWSSPMDGWMNCPWGACWLLPNVQCSTWPHPASFSFTVLTATQLLSQKLNPLLPRLKPMDSFNLLCSHCFRTGETAVDKARPTLPWSWKEWDIQDTNCQIRWCWGL